MIFVKLAQGAKLVVVNSIIIANVLIFAIANTHEDLEQCDARGSSCKTQQENSDKLAEDLNELCLECRLTSRSIDDLTRRPRQLDLYGNLDERVDLDKIAKLVCRDYMKDVERHKCRDFYFSNLPTIIDWNNHKSNVSFQDYVCIQKLKYCCPSNSFGPRCMKCPDCNPNEQCHGDTYRTGNGTCICKDGHTGPNCASCLPGYYSPGGNLMLLTSELSDQQLLVNETVCKKCHRSCKYCKADGPDGCEVCNPGYRLIPGYGCSDIDECTQEDEICGPNTFCVNTQGSYFCYDCDIACNGCHGDGPDNCLQCAKGYSMEKRVCTAPKPVIIKPEAHYARYFIYFGMAVASLILYSNNVYLSALIGLVSALYAGGSEYFMATYLERA